MEAVPKLPFIYFQIKVSPATTEFSHKLKEYILRYYHEDPEAYNKEIKDLESLRQQAACKVQRDFTGCSILKKYYSQLCLLQNRFPMSSDGQACVSFMWVDVYSGSSSTVTDIKSEQACILHNIGALHSELGAMDSRQTSEGMKISFTHFQCAAWAFQHLRDSYPQPRGTDMSQDILTFYINILLAQAQECILEKSMLDNRKCSVVAKIAAQIVEYYKSALKILESGTKSAGNNIGSIVGSKLEKSWHKYLEFKVAYHNCVTYLYLGSMAEELQKMGERLAYYQAALDKLNEAAKLGKGLETDVTDAISFTTDIVGGKLNAALKENEFVYHEKVPSIDTLPEAKGASLVKGIPFDPADPDISGPDIFARLVPMEAHESSSLYSEEKAKLIRQINADIELKDQELGSFMSSLQLEQLKLTPEPNRLPQELLDCCAALSVRPNIVKDLVSTMQCLSGLYHDVESVVQDVESLLDEESRHEKECQNMIGKRPPSMILTELRNELAKYKDAHQKASESNVTLHKAMDYHIANLNVMCGSQDDLVKKIPSLAILDSPDDDAVKTELCRLLAKVDEMKSQRNMLATQLREQIQEDDITKQLVTREDIDLQDLFAEELKKHDRMVMLINQNLYAQDSILKALTHANALYADTRRATNEICEKRQATIAGLIETYNSYDDLISKSQKGIEFYRKLESNASKLLKRAQSVCQVQQEERSKLIESHLKKMSLKDSHSSENTVASSTGPKLRDYLQHMTSRGIATVGRVAPGRSVVPTSVTAVPSDLTIGTGGVAQSFPPPPPNQLNVSRGSNKVISSGYSSCVDSELSYVSPKFPTEPRPAPVGSEHTETFPPMCSTAASTVAFDGYSSLSSSDVLPKGFQGHAPMSKLPAVPGTVPSTTQGSYGLTAGPVYGGQYVDQNRSYQSVHETVQPALVATQFVNYNLPTWYPPQSEAKVAGGAISTGLVPEYRYYDAAGVQPMVGAAGVSQSGSSYQQQASYIPPLPSAAATYSAPSYYDANYSYNHAVVYSQASNSHGTVPSHACDPGASAQQHVDVYGGQAQKMPGTDYNQSMFQNQGASVQFGASSVSPAVAYGGHVSTHPESLMQTIYQTTLPVAGMHVVHPGVAVSAYGTGTAYEPAGYGQPTPPLPLPNVLSSTLVPPQRPASVPTPGMLPAAPPGSNLSLLQQLDFVPANQLSNGTSSSEKSSCGSIPTAGKDLLSESGTSHGGSSSEVPVLKPKVLTVEDIVKQKEEVEREARCRAASRDLFSDKDVLERFVAEVEHFQKVVEGLTKQSLKGLTPIEQKWKELMEGQDRDSRKYSISVARCYAMKNRVQDIMPYDNSRVELTSLKDDYINASHVKNLSKNTAQYIATQAPLPLTMKDFWLMVFEQQVEIVAALVNDAELKGDIYWPAEKGQQAEHGFLLLSLESKKQKPWGFERIISITHHETKISRVVVHLQFTSWPPGVVPSSPSLFLQFVSDVHTFHRNQRSLSRPIVIHCSAGVGRTGVFCLVSTAIHEILAGNGIVDLWDLALRLVLMRKYVLQDKEHMKFALHAVLYFAEDVLLKRGILIKRASFDDKVTGAASRKSSHARHPSQDFVLPASHEDKVEEAVNGVPNQSSEPSAGTTSESVTTKAVKEDLKMPPSSEVALSRSNSSASVASLASVSSSASSNLAAASPQHCSSALTSKIPTTALPPSLANLDAANFSLDPMPRKSKKITKESFLNVGASGGGLSEPGDPNDPLNTLDPLWSLHK